MCATVKPSRFALTPLSALWLSHKSCNCVKRPMVGGTGPVNWLSDRLSTFKEVICIKVSVKGPASQCTDTQDCKLELFFLKRKDGKGSYFSFLNITISDFQTIEY